MLGLRFIVTLNTFSTKTQGIADCFYTFSSRTNPHATSERSGTHWCWCLLRRQLTPFLGLILSHAGNATGIDLAEKS
jgi:hypothetical protein